MGYHKVVSLVGATEVDDLVEGAASHGRATADRGSTGRRTAARPCLSGLCRTVFGLDGGGVVRNGHLLRREVLTGIRRRKELPQSPTVAQTLLVTAVPSRPLVMDAIEIPVGRMCESQTSASIS